MEIKHATLPFDWMLSSPKFVYDMLTLLLVDNMDTNTLVREHFFKCDHHVALVHSNKQALVEHFKEKSSGLLYNKARKVIFPHDTNDENTMIKYITRFDRLKQLILDIGNDITFVYISPSSGDSGNFTINGDEIIQTPATYINKIHELISNIRTDFKMIVLSATDSSDVVCDQRSITPTRSWLKMVPECKTKLGLYLDN